MEWASSQISYVLVTPTGLCHQQISQRFHLRLLHISPLYLKVIFIRNNFKLPVPSFQNLKLLFAFGVHGLWQQFFAGSALSSYVFEAFL